MTDPRSPRNRPEDEALINRCRVRPVDEDAWNIFYDRWHARVLNQVRKYAPDAADDMVQEAFVKVFRALPRYDSAVAGMDTYITRIATNVGLDYLRHGKVLRERSVPLEEGLAAVRARAQRDPDIFRNLALHIVEQTGDPRVITMIEDLIEGREVKEICQLREAKQSEVYEVRKWFQKLLQDLGASWR